MDNNRKDNSGLEPNFILNDTTGHEDKQVENSTQQQQKYNATQRTNSNTPQQANSNATQQPGSVIPPQQGQQPNPGMVRQAAPQQPSQSTPYQANNNATQQPSPVTPPQARGQQPGSGASQQATPQQAQGQANNHGVKDPYAATKKPNIVFNAQDNAQNGHQNNTFTGNSYSNGAYSNNTYNNRQTANSWNTANGYSAPKKEKPPKKPSPPITFTRKSLSLFIVLFLVVSTLLGVAGATLANNIFDGGDSPTKPSTVKGAGYTLENATNSNLSVQEITKKAQASVVEIKTESVASDSWMQQYVTEGAGSGVIVTADGYIITNNHVIDGARKITVTTSNEKEYSAKLVGTDSTTDVAVIKINADDLTTATYGNSDQLAVGDLAVAIGNPLGELGGTVTAGIISALDRQLVIDGKNMKLLQTDSSINPGNSGGGLFNSDGQLVGLVVAKSSGSDVEGLGFAIPINTVAKVAQQIMDKGYVSGQPGTGMTYVESGNDQQGGTEQPTKGNGNGSSNLYIYTVDGTNAKNAGFKSGDMIIAVDGKAISSFSDLTAVVTSHKVGDKLKFTVMRDGSTKQMTLLLEEKKS